MALIQHGSFNSFSVQPESHIFTVLPDLQKVLSVDTVAEMTREVQPIPVTFPPSDAPRGLALQSITLKKGFETFMQGFLNPKQEVYYMSWAWDMSGVQPILHPETGATPEDVILPMTVGSTRELAGAGGIVFPERVVHGGLAVRIQLWESDADVRNFGKTLKDVSNTIKTSKLTNLLNLIALGTGVTGATLVLIEQASYELASAIGTILAANSNDYVDLFEGYYPATDPWQDQIEEYRGYAADFAVRHIAG